MDRRHPVAPQCLRLLARGLGLLLLFIAWPAFALTVELLGAGQGSEPFVVALRDSLGDGNKVVTTPGPADVVVALHEGVIEEARATQRPRLFLLPASGTDLQPDETAVYWAPSLTDQLRLAQEIMPGLHRVGLLVAASDLPRAQALRSAWAARHVEVLVREAEPALLAREVGELVPSADLLLAPVDPRLYNRDNLKPVLLAAYRQNRVIIGPTPVWVRAGSLASLYATPEVLAADVAAAIHAWQQERRWPAPAQVSRFNVITNPQVARSLGVHLPDAEALTRSLQSGKAVSWP
ncbi:MAG TPA: hypothetical protein VFM34_13175 [Moraxellaceae bacterium]|nr:hypothetical protein [Moraxellaceae bacterium]